MGRAATGNRGINLRKGDYVIGAAVTPSPEARERQRREKAAELGLTAQLETIIGHASAPLGAPGLDSETWEEAPQSSNASPAGKAIDESTETPQHSRHRPPHLRPRRAGDTGLRHIRDRPSRPGQARQTRRKARPHLPASS